ncbi:MAG: hypothetical protein ACLPKB_08150 [Xanthobacteraceae bacterium]
MKNPSRSVTTWLGLMVLGGFIFGLIAKRRPFGDDVLAHPFAVFFILVGVGLILLRVVAARPVPELVPERALALGCLVGAASFLAGDWIGTHLLVLH